MVTETKRNEPENAPEQRYRFSILIADDDRGNREALGEVLENQGFRTVLAEDGGRAVELVQVDLVHLVLFDMHMPKLTGLEAMTVIRQTLDRILPAVLMTADANNDLIRRAFQAQAFSVIPKPVNTNIVLNTLSRALAKVYGVTWPNPTPPATGTGTGNAAEPTPPA
ncbi:MAG: response regulator [Planctomycetes bacterium]|nr:response regulator [Planctomycetota bacterium]